MGLVFGFAFFYILANAYHYLELRKDFYTDFNNQPLVIDIQNKMDRATKNISTFNSRNYSGNIYYSKMLAIHCNIKSCINSLHF